MRPVCTSGQQIHKYPLWQDDSDPPFYVVEARPPFDVIHADYRDDRLTLWALVNPSEPTQEYRIHVLGTGWDISFTGEHVTTVFQGPFVWHLFKELS